MKLDHVTLVAVIFYVMSTAVAQAGSKRDWQLCHKTGQADRAIRACTRIIDGGGESRANISTAYHNRARAYSGNHQYDRSLADYARAIDLDPLSVSSYRGRGYVRMKKARFNKAISDFSVVLEKEQLKPAGYKGRCWALSMLGKYKKALRDCNKALKYSPKNSWNHLNRARIYYKLGYNEPALEDANAAGLLNPENIKIKAYRGLILLALDRRAEALADFNAAIENRKDDNAVVLAYYGRGRLYQEDQLIDDAISDYEATKTIKGLEAHMEWARTEARQRLGRLRAHRRRQSAKQVVITRPPPSFSLSSPQSSSSGHRVALVIGNSRYVHLSTLANPQSDARSLASVLRKHGFKVKEYYNLRRGDFLDALEEFRDQAKGADQAIVFYAGHGMNLNGRDIIAPIDMQYDCAERRYKRAVQLSELQKAIATVPNKVLLLDSCRNEPFPQCRTRGTGAATGGFRGLGRLATSRGKIVIANATLLGKLSADGVAGQHSPFTAALLARLRSSPRVFFRDLLEMVSEDVSQATGGNQVPEVKSQGGPQRICLAGRRCRHGN